MEILVSVLVLLVGLLGGWIVFPKKKKPPSFQEWSEIYFDGYNSGIKNASDVLESFAFDEATRSAALRWSGLIRTLQRPHRAKRESSKR